MTDRKDEYLQTLGSMLFLETAGQLANIQRVNPGYIDQNLKLNLLEKAPRFPAVHGVWYNKNGFLQSHRDKTWNRGNKTSQTEWVLSISLGANAHFTYHHPNEKEGYHSTVESGDVLLFNGAYLHHGVKVLENSIPKWWGKELGNLQGRLSLHYRVLTGTARSSKDGKERNQPETGKNKETLRPKNICSDVKLRKPPSTNQDNRWLMRVEDKPSRNPDNRWLMRVEDQPHSIPDNSCLLRVEEKPSTTPDNNWLMRVEDKPSTTPDNSWLMRVEDKPSTTPDNSWLMRVEDKPSTTPENSWLMRVEDKPSTTPDNTWLMRVEDKPSITPDNSWLMRVEDKPSTTPDNSWLMRVEDKPSITPDNSWLMRVEDKPSTSPDNSWLMRVEDKHNTTPDNTWLMRVEDKPSTTPDNPWLMRAEDKPSTTPDNSWLMRVEDKPSTTPDNSWLTRVEDKPNTTPDNTWLMRVEDKPSTTPDNSLLMRVVDKSSTTPDNRWLMRVEDKPPSTTPDNSWLIRVEDKLSTTPDNTRLMRVEDRPSTTPDNTWLMRVEDKPSTTPEISWLMRVEDKPNTTPDNSWLMRVEDKPSTTPDNTWLMRVEDKPSTTPDNSWLMRVEDKPSTTPDNTWLMRVEDKPSTTPDNSWLMRVEDKPSTTQDNSWLMRVEDKPSTTSVNSMLMRKKDKLLASEKAPAKCTNLGAKETAVCEIRFVNQSALVNTTSGMHFPPFPQHSHDKKSETAAWLPLVDEKDKELKRNPDFLNGFEPGPYLDFTKTLFKKFWCFNHTINKDHQIRAILALGGNANSSEVKKEFYEKLKLIQGLNIPVHDKKIMLSFQDSDVIESMYKSGLLVNPKDFILNGDHIFSKEEQRKITEKTTAALNFIQQADNVLFESMMQVVACIGYYKATDKVHLGGTVSSAVGLIWLDPSKGGDWSIPFLAEQIVHEYIHTTLLIAEMVRGMYTDASLIPTSLVVSAIRRQKRGYDKAFHAAYVATGLVAFHSETGRVGRAVELAKYLNQSVHDLEKVQLETGILDNTGSEMLVHLKNFLRKARVM